MLGRLLGGISTSLLFSVFEAWLIRAHSDRDLPKSCLSKSFSMAAFGNSCIAILAGLVANKFAHLYPMEKFGGSGITHIGGFLNPFDLAFLALIVCGIGAKMLWEDNYGDVGGSSDQEAKTEDNRKKSGNCTMVCAMRLQLQCKVVIFCYAELSLPSLKGQCTFLSSCGHRF